MNMPLPPNMHSVAVLILTVLALVLFSRDHIPLESSSLIVIVALAVGFQIWPISFEGQVLRAVDLFSGFGHEALIAVCALMIAGNGLIRTGALEPVGHFLAKIWIKRPKLSLLLTLLVGAATSAFINNVPIVVLLMPILISVSMRTGIPASSILMPMGFATLIGGMTTTIGTSTNLLVVSVAADMGLRRIQMFDFLAPTMIIGFFAIAYLWLIAPKITIPLVLPSILSGSLLIMLYSMAHFGTVAVLGIEAGIFNIPTLIYEKIHQSAGSFNSIRAGTVLATVLVITAAIIMFIQNRVLNRGRYQIIAGKSFRPVETRLRGFRTPLFVLCITYIAFTILLPTITIFLVGGLKTYGLPFTAENLTLVNYKYILFDWKLTRDAIWNSLTLGLGAALITMFAGVMISYVIVKMKVRGKGILEFLGMLPFSVPGSVIALGVMLAWSGKFGINIYNTVWIILVAYIARYMAFSLRANSAALAQVHDSLVEAAQASGASMGQALRDIVLPLVRPGMFAAFFLIFLPALRELTVSVLLYGPTTRTIGVAIYTLNEDGETVYSAALAGIALLIIVTGQTIISRFTQTAK